MSMGKGIPVAVQNETDACLIKKGGMVRNSCFFKVVLESLSGKRIGSFWLSALLGR